MAHEYLGRGDDITGAAAPVDLLVIATPDAAVGPVATAVRPRPECVVVHMAGSLGLDVLDAHPRRGTLHPLVSLPNPSVGARRLTEGAWFAVAGDPLVAQIVDQLRGRPITVADEDRAAYHAAACIASNHLVALMGQVQRVAVAAGVPFDAYLDLARATLENVAELGPAAALTGPAARGDEATLERHRAALGPTERHAYDALAAAARRLAELDRSLQEIVMRTLTTIAEIRALADEARATGRTVGFVPTMGYLHEGHASLMDAAGDSGDVVVASVFVNPLQFGASEDLDAYRRDLERDMAIAADHGVDLLFVPSGEEMYPRPMLTEVRVNEITTRFEGASRPTHFAGVATVVTKLLAIVGPCRAYFGEKDWQQVCVVRRMASDLSLPVEVVACPTVREPDGLALSSRNVYLRPDERAAAPVLRRAILAGAALIEAGERDPSRVEAAMAGLVATEPLVDLDYAAAVDAETLAPLAPLAGEVRLLIAAQVGRPRLLDNVGATVR